MSLRTLDPTRWEVPRAVYRAHGTGTRQTRPYKTLYNPYIYFLYVEEFVNTNLDLSLWYWL
jgi:hypothetical protein